MESPTFKTKSGRVVTVEGRPSASDHGSNSTVQ